MTYNKECYRTLSIRMIKWHKKGQLIKKVTEPILYKWQFCLKRIYNKESYKTLSTQMILLHKKGQLIK